MLAFGRGRWAVSQHLNWSQTAIGTHIMKNQSQSRISESKSKVDFVDFIRSSVWKCYWIFLQILPLDHFVLVSKWVAFKSTKKFGIMNLMLQWFCYCCLCILCPWCIKSLKMQNNLLPASCRIDWGTRRWFWKRKSYLWLLICNKTYTLPMSHREQTFFKWYFLETFPGVNGLKSLT